MRVCVRVHTCRHMEVRGRLSRADQPFLRVGAKDRAQVSGLAAGVFPALEADWRCAQSHLDEMKTFVADMAVCVCRWAPDKE